MDKNSKAYKRLVNNLMKTDDGSKFIIEVTGWLCLENNMDEVSEYIAPVREQFASAIRNRLRFSDVKDTYPNNAKIRKLYKKYIGK